MRLGITIVYGAKSLAVSVSIGSDSALAVRMYRFFCPSTDRQGRFKVVRLTVKKRMRATLDAIRVELMRRRHESVAIVGKWLNRVVQGYFNYHAVPGNLYRLAGMRSEICRA